MPTTTTPSGCSPAIITSSSQSPSSGPNGTMMPRIRRPENWMAGLRRRFRVRSHLHRCILCEFYCTAFYIFLGTSVNAQHILSVKQLSDWLGVSLGWGIALALALQMGSYVSGPHLNPAVSIFFFSFGRISARRFLLYSVAQTAGAFVGAALTFLVYRDALNAFDGGERQVSGATATAGILFPNPQPYLGTVNGIVDQILGTAALCICIAMVTDRGNGIPLAFQPSLCGLAMTLLGLALDLNAGYEINPARDVGPKLFALCAGYGSEVFSAADYRWFWIPILCPFAGALVGAWTYQLFVGFQVNDQAGEREQKLSLAAVDERQLS